ncbi:hypothetical protein Vafri_3467, partial [Volvox africanus]
NESDRSNLSVGKGLSFSTGEWSPPLSSCAKIAMEAATALGGEEGFILWLGGRGLMLLVLPPQASPLSPTTEDDPQSLQPLAAAAVELSPLPSAVAPADVVSTTGVRISTVPPSSPPPLFPRVPPPGEVSSFSTSGEKSHCASDPTGRNHGALISSTADFRRRAGAPLMPTPPLPYGAARLTLPSVSIRLGVSPGASPRSRLAPLTRPTPLQPEVSRLGLPSSEGPSACECICWICCCGDSRREERKRLNVLRVLAREMGEHLSPESAASEVCPDRPNSSSSCAPLVEAGRCGGPPGCCCCCC